MLKRIILSFVWMLVFTFVSSFMLGLSHSFWRGIIGTWVWYIPFAMGLVGLVLGLLGKLQGTRPTKP